VASPGRCSQTAVVLKKSLVNWMSRNSSRVGFVFPPSRPFVRPGRKGRFHGVKVPAVNRHSVFGGYSDFVGCIRKLSNLCDCKHAVQFLQAERVFKGASKSARKRATMEMLLQTSRQATQTLATTGPQFRTETMVFVFISPDGTRFIARS
jgi:hypothetical protein